MIQDDYSCPDTKEILHSNWLSFLDRTSQRYVGPAAAPLKCYLVLSILDFDQKLFSTLEDSHWHSEAQFLLLFLIGVARKYKAIQLCIYSKVGIFNTWLWLGGILSNNQSPLSNLRVASSQAQSWSTPSKVQIFPSLRDSTLPIISLQIFLLIKYLSQT